MLRSSFTALLKVITYKDICIRQRNKLLHQPIHNNNHTHKPKDSPYLFIELHRWTFKLQSCLISIDDKRHLDQSGCKILPLHRHIWQLPIFNYGWGSWQIFMKLWDSTFGGIVHFKYTLFMSSYMYQVCNNVSPFIAYTVLLTLMRHYSPSKAPSEVGIVPIPC